VLDQLEQPGIAPAVPVGLDAHLHAPLAMSAGSH
jgi:hypothetical protein